MNVHLSAIGRLLSKEFQRIELFFSLLVSKVHVPLRKSTSFYILACHSNIKAFSTEREKGN